MQENTTTITAICPSCQQHGVFTRGGVQSVPVNVAEKLGLTTGGIPQWHCANCSSTVSEPDLLDVNLSS